MKTNQELLAQAKAEKQNAELLAATLINGTVLQNENVQSYVLLLENLLEFELKCERTIAKEYGRDDIDEVVSLLFKQSFGDHTEAIRNALNEKIASAMHSSLLEIC